MSIDELMENSRSALVGVLPAVQKVDIPWRRGEAYDEWDSIASVLFNSLVQEPIRWSLEERHRSSLRILPYDCIVDNAGPFSFIRLIGNHDFGGFVFHSFQTSENPFDVVMYRTLDSRGAFVSEIGSIPVVDAHFALFVPGVDCLMTDLEGC